MATRKLNVEEPKGRHHPKTREVHTIKTLTEEKRVYKKGHTEKKQVERRWEK